MSYGWILLNYLSLGKISFEGKNARPKMVFQFLTLSKTPSNLALSKIQSNVAPSASQFLMLVSQTHHSMISSQDDNLIWFEYPGSWKFFLRYDKIQDFQKLYPSFFSSLVKLQICKSNWTVIYILSFPNVEFIRYHDVFQKA